VRASLSYRVAMRLKSFNLLNALSIRQRFDVARREQVAQTAPAGDPNSFGGRGAKKAWFCAFDRTRSGHLLPARAEGVDTR
jgi:hypothetical protein